MENLIEQWLLKYGQDFTHETISKVFDNYFKAEEMKKQSEFCKAFSSFQSECPLIKQTKKVKNKDGTTRYSHAVLDEMTYIINPILGKNGLSFSFNLLETESEGKAKLETIVYHVSGHKQVSYYIFDTLDDGGHMNNSQRRKSALSYAKRAALENALGLATTGEDDDAVRAIDKTITQEQKEEIEQLIKETNTDIGQFVKFLKIESMERLESLDELSAKKAIKALRQKRQVK